MTRFLVTRATGSLTGAPYEMTGPTPTRDAATRTADTLLNGSVRITPRTRINAEPAPQLERGDLGTLHTGSGAPTREVGAPPAHYDYAAIQSDLETVLSPAEVAKVLAIMRRASGAGSGRVNRVGVVAIDKHADVRESLVQVHANIDRNVSIAQQTAAFWDRKQEEHDRALGLRR